MPARGSISISLVIFLGTGIPTPSAFAQTDIAVRDKASILRITCSWDQGEKVSMGTGIVVSDSGLVLTAAHVIPDIAATEPLLCYGYPGGFSDSAFKLVRTSNVDRGATVDIGYLQAENPTGLKKIGLDSKSPVETQADIIVAGSRRDSQVAYYHGTIATAPQLNKVVDTDVDIWPGFSGGPVYLKATRQIIGFVHSGIPNSEFKEKNGLAGEEMGHARVIMFKSVAAKINSIIAENEKRRFSPSETNLRLTLLSMTNGSIEAGSTTMQTLDFSDITDATAKALVSQDVRFDAEGKSSGANAKNGAGVLYKTWFDSSKMRWPEEQKSTGVEDRKLIDGYAGWMNSDSYKQTKYWNEPESHSKIAAPVWNENFDWNSVIPGAKALAAPVPSVNWMKSAMTPRHLSQVEIGYSISLGHVGNTTLPVKAFAAEPGYKITSFQIVTSAANGIVANAPILGEDAKSITQTYKVDLPAVKGNPRAFFGTLITIQKPAE
ncbi:S1 family peptidase [Paraburkholderia antibiotica]|uniref:Trypsin-like peptidase domain-containing protein n=1 Tax=Paraburkholderia antibiotica TaxID=2728839 RepID=A0A7X9X4V6_9BURK|nr:serine protease [Paraburkholderia antibiotica]NML31484.1 trypsin-like peptidase domain-containing protein [Paraburkholderia antibiotica]